MPHALDQDEAPAPQVGAEGRPSRAACYGPLVREHFERPRNQRSMPDASATAEVCNPVCGDRLRLFLRIADSRVVEATFQAQGCPATIAASSIATEMLRGRSLEAARALQRDEVAMALGGLPRAKIHCSVLVEEAVELALRALLA